MDWFGSRYDAGWIYRRVSWGSWEEGSDYAQVDGASVDFSAFDSVKVSGSATYMGDPIDETDLMSLAYTFADAAGERAVIPVATLLPEADAPEFRALGNGCSARTGSVKLYSVLKVLSDIKCGKTLVVPAGTDAIKKAVEIIEGAGLRTNRPSLSHILRNDRVFEDDASMLTVVNSLIAAAGCGSVVPDERGTVLISKYAEPTERPLVWTFRDDESSTLGFGVAEDSDWRNIPNVLSVTHSDGESTLRAVARNIDAEHKASLPRRGWREKTETEAVDELPGATREEKLAALGAIAETRLKARSAEIRKVRISTLFVPVKLGDAVEIVYGGRRWAGTITSMAVSCVPSGEMTIEVRCFLRRELAVEIRTEVL